MFNLGPMELVVLAIVGLVVIGPEKLPSLAKQAAQMLKTLRELASGAREQLRDELGPEFADVDLRTLNPRTVVSRAVFGDDFDPSTLNPRQSLQKAVFGDEGLSAADPRSAIRETRDSIMGRDQANGRVDFGKSGATPASPDLTKPTSGPHPGQARAADAPRPRPRPRPTYNDDIL